MLKTLRVQVGITPLYFVTHVALAPSIVEAILDRRGTHLTLEMLMKPFPASWDEQRSALQLD